jgi:hypothetical protein
MGIDDGRPDESSIGPQRLLDDQAARQAEDQAS